MKHFRILVFLILSVLVVGLALSVGYFGYQIKQLRTGDFVYWPYHPNGERFERYIGAQAPESSWLPVNELPEHCQHILVEAEDFAFWDHHGVVWGNLWIAARINFHYGRIVFGASTITQQLVKNLFLWREKSFLRKSLEIVGAVMLDAALTKDEQLALYINAVEFGADIYGISEAARVYFEKDPKELSVLECGVLAGVLPFPRRHSVSLAKGEFDAAIAEDVSPMLKRYAQAFPKRAQPLLELLDLAIYRKTLRNLKQQTDQG